MAKEIDDSKNQVFISQVKEIYNKRFIEYKQEFSTAENIKDNTLKCMAAYFWNENQREILKKNILAEAYAEVHPDHEAFSAIDEMSTLYLAL